LTEKQKIEALIAHVEGLKEAVFVRNDANYDSATAVLGMKQKWNWNSWRISTARDFIKHVASTSSTTGKPYLIKLQKDASAISFGEYLTKELERLESAAH